MPNNFGLTHIYTGDGKGKTTAALGLCLRCVGCEDTVYMIQFLKGTHSGELDAALAFGDRFKIFRFESSEKFFWNMDEHEKQTLHSEVAAAFAFARQCIETKECDMLVLDEIFGAASCGLIDNDEILELMGNTNGVELVMTGRDPHLQIVERADYVSRIEQVAHPFDRGMAARRGVEF